MKPESKQRFAKSVQNSCHQALRRYSGQAIWENASDAKQWLFVNSSKDIENLFVAFEWRDQVCAG
jgi:hypothetical protein